MVLEMRYKGRNIKPGDKVLKSSKIDLVLGDGKMSYEEEIERIALLIQQKKCQMNNNVESVDLEELYEHFKFEVPKGQALAD
jgi:hypothetical protein